MLKSSLHAFPALRTATTVAYIAFFALFSFSTYAEQAVVVDKSDDYFDLSLEELMDIEITCEVKKNASV